MIFIAAMTEIASHVGNEPWPPLEVASRWFDRASIVLAMSLLFGFGATAVIVWLGIVKEHHWDLLRDRSNEKVAGLELETAKANAEAGKANSEIARAHEAIAEANARAAEANLKAETERAERLKLEVKLAPRSLSVEQQSSLSSQLADLKDLRIDLIAYETGGADVAPLSGQIGNGLMSAGMKVYLFTPFADGTVVRGILVRCPNDAPEDIKAAMARIVLALRSVGLDAGIWQPFPAGEPPSGAYNGPQGAAPDAKIRLLIGGKP
jgi:hypothetical protein